MQYGMTLTPLFNEAHSSKQETHNKTVVDNRLPAPSRNGPLDYNLLPCCGVALPVAGATP